MWLLRSLPAEVVMRELLAKRTPPNGKPKTLVDHTRDVSADAATGAIRNRKRCLLRFSWHGCALLPA